MMNPLPLTAFSAALLLGLSSLPAQSKPSSQPATGQTPVKVHARKDDISKLDRAALVKKLDELLTQIKGLMQSKVDPVLVEDRLRNRTPSYRQVKVVDGPTKGPEEKAAPTKDQPITTETAKPKVRLFGDSEKADLPKGTVLLVDGMPITEADVKKLEDFYNGYASKKPGTARQKALEALIVVRSIQAQYKDNLPKLEKEMAEIRKSIVEGGADFAEVAKKRSHGPSSNQGGDLGFFVRDQMVPAFSQAAFALKIGGVSEAFASPFGIHIVKVTGRKKGATPSEDQVRASHILLLYDKDSQALRGLMQQAMAGKSSIAVLNDEWRKSLPAAYR